MNDTNIQKLKECLRIKVSLVDSVFEARWSAILEDFKKWEFGPIGQNVSRIVVQLEFLRRLCVIFPDSQLQNDEEIIKLVVSDAKAVGNHISLPPQIKAKVVRREISDRFGILYTLETAEGSRFTRELFD